MVSACLLGQECEYNGGDIKDAGAEAAASWAKGIMG